MAKGPVKGRFVGRCIDANKGVKATSDGENSHGPQIFLRQTMDLGPNLY